MISYSTIFSFGLLLLNCPYLVKPNEDDINGVNVINYREMCTGTPERKPGSMNKMPGFFQNPTQENDNYNAIKCHFEDCMHQCMEDINCQTAYYLYHPFEKGTCKFYKEDINMTKSLHGDVYLRWKLCDEAGENVCLDPNTGTSTSTMRSNRCAGYWVRNMGYQFKKSSLRMNLDSAVYKEFFEAQKACLQSISCGAIEAIKLKSEHNRVHYRFYRGWPYGLESSLVKMDNYHDSIVNVWKCADCPEHFNKTKWRITNNSTVPDLGKVYFASYFTGRAEECRLECERINMVYTRRYMCLTVYYNHTTNICLLTKISENKHHNKSCLINSLIKVITNGSLFTQYDLNKTFARNYKGSDSLWIHYADEIFHYYLKHNFKDGVCHCLDQNFDVYADNCGSPDYTQKINKILKGLALRGTTKSPIYFNEFYYHQLDTGNEYVWIKTAQLNNISDICSAKNCAIFSAAVLKPFSSVVKNIIDRNVWEAQKPHRFTKLSTINNVIIETSAMPYCGCIGVDHCSDELRSMQIFNQNKLGNSDIRFSFFVDDVGRMYEGVGWHRTCSTVPGYIKDSITIAFIGDFSKSGDVPELAALNSVKIFLLEAKLSHKISPDYNLYSRYDLFGLNSTNMNNKKKDKILRLLLTNWPNYKGHKKKTFSCGLRWKIPLVIASCALAIIIIAVVTLAYRYGYLHLSTCKTTCKLFHQKLINAHSVNVLFPNVDFPLIDSKIVSQQSRQIQFHSKNTKLAINLNISSFCFVHTICNNFKCMCLASTTALYEVTQTKNESNFLELLYDSYFLQNCPHKSAVMIFQPKTHLELNFILILHCANLNDLEDCILRLLDNKLCLCRGVTIQFCSQKTNQLEELLLSDEIVEISSDTSVENLKKVRLNGEKLKFEGFVFKFDDILVRNQESQPEMKTVIAEE